MAPIVQWSIMGICLCEECTAAKGQPSATAGTHCSLKNASVALAMSRLG